MELKVNQEVTLKQKLVRLAIITTIAGGLFSILFFAVFNIASTSETIAGTQSSSQECFTISDSENKIYRFRLSDGTILSSKSLSSASDVEAATLNLDGDTLWMLNSDELHYSVTSGTMANVKISGSNISAQKLSGSLGYKYISDFDAMSVDKDGNIWAGSSNNSPLLLVVLDRSTGNVKKNYFGSGNDYLEIDNSNYTALRFDAMAFDPVTNELYANMNGSSYNYDYLFNINTTTGFMTLVRQFNTIDDVEGMGFDAKGDLYVTTGANASSSSLKNTMWKVDLFNGEVTKMFSLWGGDMETCDCVLGNPITTNEISGYVFYDEDKDTIFDSGEIGKNGINVLLYSDANSNGKYDSGTDIFVDSLRTYSDGYFQFRLNYSSGTEKYVMFVDTNGLPENSYLTTNNIETASFSTGRNIDSNNNFGFATDSSQYWNIIKGTVFKDVNEDGILNNSEEGVSGVKVRLYADNNCNGIIDGSDEVIDSSVVGTDGKYSFIREYKPSTSGGTATISKRVSSSYDDAEEDGGSMTRTSSDLDFGEVWAGVRFRSIGIPQGATITSAYLQFTADGNKSGSCSLRIYGEDTNDADQFSSSDDDITDRTRTTAYSNWSPTSWLDNNTYNSPELKSIVQEIVDRSGWVSGADMVFIVKSISGYDRDAQTYDENTSKAPLLVIEYEDGSSSSSTSDCYITSIDENTKPTASSLTTDNIETAQFTSGGNSDIENDFGLWGGALPVTWLTFDGRYVGESIELTWATGSEDNNSHFEIERSEDASNWDLIATVNGNGTSSKINRYMSMDDQPFEKINYYRIKQVDFDGQFDYSKIVVMSKELGKAQFTLNTFPNPARDFVNITWNKNLKTGVLDITDISGKVLQSVNAKNLGNVHRFDLSNYDQGVYFVNFKSEQYSSSKKIVVYK